MPLADNCYLNIPFKQYLKQLRVDKNGKISQQDLDRAAQQEFENYKAIERRINDSSCAGSCSCVIARYLTNTVTLTKGVTSAAFFTLTEDFNYGGFSLASNVVTVPSDGAYRLYGQFYAVLNTIDAATPMLKYDVFEFQSAGSAPFPFADAGFVNNDQGFSYTSWSGIIRYSSAASDVFRVRARIDEVISAAGDSLDIEGWVAAEKICGCSSATP